MAKTISLQAGGVRVIFGKTKSGFVVTFFRPGMSASAESTLKTLEKSKEKGNEKSREKIIRILSDNPRITTIAQILLGT